MIDPISIIFSAALLHNVRIVENESDKSQISTFHTFFYIIQTFFYKQDFCKQRQSDIGKKLSNSQATP